MGISKQTPILAPSGKMGKIHFAVEGWLYRHGLFNPAVRLLIAMQIVTTAVIILFGGALFWHTQWVLWIGLGASLAVSNLYFLAKKLQVFFPSEVSLNKIIGVLLNFYFRLFVTAIILFVFIAWFKAPIPALLIGLTLSVGTAIVFGLTRLHLLKSKEV